MTKGRTWIGTSGWLYKHWKGPFYPEDIPQKNHFSFFATHFKTVELNNPFYRLPSPETFNGWREKAPEDFLYAVKASRYITHIKRLKDPEESVELLLKNASELKEKLGPILFQLPPSMKFDEERLEIFLRSLPRDHRFTMEFRNNTWYNEDCYDMLRKYNIAFCIYELEYHKSPELCTAEFVYIRLHGPGRKYQGSYSDKSLEEWATKSKAWNKKGIDVYIYFDNDQNAYAAHNAMTLQEMIK